MLKLFSRYSCPKFSLPRSRVNVFRICSGIFPSRSFTTLLDSEIVPSFILPIKTTPETRSLIVFNRSVLCLDTMVSSSQCPICLRLSTTAGLFSIEGNSGLHAFCACLKPFFWRLTCLRGKYERKSSQPFLAFALPLQLI